MSTTSTKCPYPGCTEDDERDGKNYMCIDELEDWRKARRWFQIGLAKQLESDLSALQHQLVSGDSITVREVLCRIEIKVQQIRNAMAKE